MSLTGMVQMIPRYDDFALPKFKSTFALTLLRTRGIGRAPRSSLSHLKSASSPFPCTLDPPSILPV
jgi:hypothetical protein